MNVSQNKSNWINMKTHWKKQDFRIESLSETIAGLEKSISVLSKKPDQYEWYDGIFLLEDVEPIIGITFIALQNYINSSIYDLEETSTSRLHFYTTDKIISDSGKTRIELIIGLANYFKHRDENNDLHFPTRNLLDQFGFIYGENYEIEKSPLLLGLELLIENWNLPKLVDIVSEWRESLWQK